MSGRKNAQRFETVEEKYYLAWSRGNSTVEARKHTSQWIMRTAIFHYSNGTNKCCIEGCNASIEALTLEHENFDRVELNRKLGVSDRLSGTNLAYALLNRQFPDVNITVKCMLHNALNQHPKNIGTSIQRTMGRNKLKSRLYALYNYKADLTNMSWEHSFNDGSIHRLYLRHKYNIYYEKYVSGDKFNQLLLREYKLNIPNWPGLIVQHRNDNHISGKGTSGKTNYNSFWTEDQYKPFRDSLTEEQKERMKNETNV